MHFALLYATCGWLIVMQQLPGYSARIVVHWSTSKREIVFRISGVILLNRISAHSRLKSPYKFCENAADLWYLLGIFWGVSFDSCHNLWSMRDFICNR